MGDFLQSWDLELLVFLFNSCCSRIFLVDLVTPPGVHLNFQISDLGGCKGRRLRRQDMNKNSHSLKLRNLVCWSLKRDRQILHAFIYNISVVIANFIKKICSSRKQRCLNKSCQFGVNESLSKAFIYFAI